MLGKAMVVAHGFENVDLMELYQLTALLPDGPRIKVSHNRRVHLKTPDELQMHRAKYAASKVILLVRDPRDVMVSSYFYHTRRVRHYTCDISSFIRDQR